MAERPGAERVADHCEPKIRGKPQRHDRERRERVKREADHAGERIVAGAGSASGSVVSDRQLVKPELTMPRMKRCCSGMLLRTSSTRRVISRKRRTKSVKSWFSHMIAQVRSLEPSLRRTNSKSYQEFRAGGRFTSRTFRRRRRRIGFWPRAIPAAVVSILQPRCSKPSIIAPQQVVLE